MARADTRTWLSLDRWAEIVGINPAHFNQFASSTLFPNWCGQPWYQFDWQDADRASREAIARAIQLAEDRISAYLGYNLLPDWHDEILPYPQPISPELYGYVYNPRWARKSINLSKAHVISGGVRASSLIEAGVAIVRSDEDGDGYEELCTVTVVTSVTDCEIHVYYPGESGADEWEIRPVKITSAGGTATITFKSWQVPDPDLLSALDAAPLTLETDGNYITTVDIYRVYNDPQTQALFMWERLPEDECGSTAVGVNEWSTQNACLQIRNNRLGLALAMPGTWDSDDEQFDVTAMALARDPDKVRFYYYSGWEDNRRTCPRTEMDRGLETAVAHFAATLLDRDMCACNNVQTYLDYWRTDLARLGSDEAYANSQMILGNPFGTMRGAVHAYTICNDERRRVGK